MTVLNFKQNITFLLFLLFSFPSVYGFSKDNVHKNENLYIVEFVAKPLIDCKDNLKNNRLYDSKEILKRFNQDFQRFSGKESLKSSSITPKIRCQYYKLLSGVSLEADSSMISKIKTLPYVKRIYVAPEIWLEKQQATQQVTATDFLEQTKIREFSEKHNLSGKNIKIGLIDSGVDYTHPDLGGIGDGYKVIGGYDYIDNDDDPMDIMGHGTACAGIIVGEGTINGVAPDAKIYAYRMFNDEGQGDWDAFLKSLEACLDPNNDDLFDDKVDIVSLSVQSTGSTNESFDVIRRLVENDVIVITIAGNYSTQLEDVTYPGRIFETLTVGSVDGFNEVSWFSGRGSMRPNQIKPDVLAPGENIYTTGLNNSFNEEYGTSMAAPIVAGFAALLKEMSPLVNNVDIKSIICQSTDTLTDASVFFQGHGQINALKAENISTTINIPRINLGVDSLDADQAYTVTKTFLLKNISGLEQEYNYVAPSDQPNGIEMTLDKETFSLASFESIEVELTMRVVNSFFPLEQEETANYHIGSLYFEVNNNDTLKVPWHFKRTGTIKIQMDDQLQKEAIILYNENYSNVFDYSFADNIDKELSLSPPPGIYDIIYIAEDETDSYLFVEEQVNFNENIQISFEKDSAKHDLSLQGFTTDNQNIPPDSDANRYLLELPLTEFSLGNGSFTEEMRIVIGRKGLLRCSEVSDRYEIIGAKYDFDPNTNELCFVDFPSLKGIHKDTVLTQIAPFVSFPIKLYGDGNMASLSIYLQPSLANPILPNKLDLATKQFNTETLKWDGLFSYSRSKEDRQVMTFYTEFDTYTSHRYTTSFLEMSGDSITFLTAPLYNSPGAYYSTPDETMILGNGITVPSGLISGSNNFRIDFFEARGVNRERYGRKNIKVSIFNNDGILEVEDEIQIYTGQKTFDFTPSQHYVELSNNYYLQGVEGETVLRGFLKGDNSDSYLPQLLNFQVRNHNDIPSPCLTTGETGKVIFSLYDQHEILVEDSVKTYYKSTTSDQWLPLTTKYIGKNLQYNMEYHSELPIIESDTDTSIDIKIVAVDNGNNRLEVIVSPAFFIGAQSRDYLLNLAALRDTTIIKNQTLILPLSVETYFDEFNNYTLSAACSSEFANCVIENDTLKVTPSQNWTGSVIVNVKVQDRDIFDEEDFELHVDFPSSVDLAQEGDFLVFPNPCKDKLNVRIPENIKVGSIKIYNSSGILVIQKPVNDKKQVNFHLSQLLSGVYYIVFEGSISNKVLKFVKI